LLKGWAEILAEGKSFLEGEMHLQEGNDPLLEGGKYLLEED